jgi:hypothetical protein
MFVIIGYVVVLIAVLGGYAMAGGHFGQGRAARAFHHLRCRARCIFRRQLEQGG